MVRAISSSEKYDKCVSLCADSRKREMLCVCVCVCERARARQRERA
jgi:hypothetical protein